MFHPPFCPNESCFQHENPTEDFYTGNGTYSAKCRTRPIPRFRCKACRRSFSVQTFRADYHDKKPEVNRLVIELLTLGVGFRTTAIVVGLSRRCLELKARKLSNVVAQLDRNLRRSFIGRGPLTRTSVHFDEQETFEMCRNTMPLSLPVAVDSASRFIYGAIAAPIRPKGKMTKARRSRIARHESRYGPRVDRSRAACLKVLKSAAEMMSSNAVVELFTDEKTTYPGLAAKAFGPRLTAHRRTSSKVIRDRKNPLFKINHEEAMFRDRISRTRRQSWLASKEHGFLNLHLRMYSAVRNYVRPRFNRDKSAVPGSPAELLGVTPRRLKRAELIGWRQVWGARSLCPLENPADLGYELSRAALV